MSLLDLQAALLRVYCDPGARQALGRGERDLADEFALDAAELDCLQSLVREQSARLEMFARTLDRKREDSLVAFFPLVLECLGAERWRTLAAAFRERHPRAATADRDAVAFGDFIARMALDDDRALLGDLIAYETSTARLSAHPPPAISPFRGGAPESTSVRLAGSACLGVLWHRPSDFARLIATARERLPAPARVPVMYYRGAGDSGVCTLELAPLLYELLRRADGARPLMALLASVEERLTQPATVAHVLETLTKLHHAGALELISTGTLA